MLHLALRNKRLQCNNGLSVQHEAAVQTTGCGRRVGANRLLGWRVEGEG